MMSAVMYLLRSSAMSSLITHSPGVLTQQQKQPVQGLIFCLARKMFSVSAPASCAPFRNASTMKCVLPFSARGLPLKTMIFIG